MIADRRGRAIGFRIGPWQARELPHAIPLLDQLSGVPKWVVADRGYSSHCFRHYIWTTGARPAIPTKRNEVSLACPGSLAGIAPAGCSMIQGDPLGNPSPSRERESRGQALWRQLDHRAEVTWGQIKQ